MIRVIRAMGTTAPLHRWRLPRCCATTSSATNGAIFSDTGHKI